MDMVWHNDIFVHNNTGIMLRDALNCLFNKMPILG